MRPSVPVVVSFDGFDVITGLDQRRRSTTSNSDSPITPFSWRNRGQGNHHLRAKASMLALLVERRTQTFKPWKIVSIYCRRSSVKLFKKSRDAGRKFRTRI
jgi:hypothetical protein